MEIRHRSEEHTSELQSRSELVCRLLLEKKKTQLGEARTLFVIFWQPVVHFVEADGDDFARVFFFFNDTATTEIYTLSLHDALPDLFLKLACVLLAGRTANRRHRPGSGHCVKIGRAHVCTPVTIRSSMNTRD